MILVVLVVAIYAYTFRFDQIKRRMSALQIAGVS